MTSEPIMPSLTAAELLTHLPHCVALGIYVVSHDDELILALPYSEKLIGDPTQGIIHGGAVSVLLDSACGGACHFHPENSIHTATIDLRIDYMRPAKVGATLFASAQVYQTTRHVAFLRGIAWDEDRAHPVAMAAGAFTFQKRAG